MAESDEDKLKLPGWVTTAAEEAAAAAPGIAGSFVGPLAAAAGAIAGVGVKVAIAAVRTAAAYRTQRRAESFEAELASRLEQGDPQAIQQLVEGDERFAEVVFQNYRRAMDALDPGVIPALAVLTFLYRKRSPDGFFKAIGLLLEELTGDEFRVLRQILTAIAAVSARWGGVSTVEITPTRNAAGRQELHFTHRKDRKNTFACAAPAESLRVLDLMKRHGVAPGFSDEGADLALTNRLELDVDTCERVLSVSGREDVALFEVERPGPGR